MDFSSLDEKKKQEFSDLMFSHLSSASELKDWVQLYLNIELPSDITDPESTSSPLNAIWQIYETFKLNKGDVNPGYVLLSSRESYKTLSVSILEILLLLHMQLDIGHASATEEQSAVAIGYINNFILQVQPLMEIAGWKADKANKRLIKFTTPQGKTPFIKIVICTPKGMNSLHCNLFITDELDLADPAAMKEGQYITSYSKGIHGVKVYLSTRKYAFGLMAEAIDKAPERNHKILKWNILDVTESCPTSRHEPDGLREDRYIAKNLPLKQLTKEEFDLLSESEKLKFDLIKDAMKGCQSCSLLPVCKMRLAQKPSSSTGTFFKPISSVKQQFLENDPDSAEAQLLCLRPGSTGLVYPRFNPTVDIGNVLSLKNAYSKLTGSNYNGKYLTESQLLQKLHQLEIPIYAGVDWGYVHDSVIILMAKLPNDEIWVIDCFAAPGLEFQDILQIAISYRDKYKIQKWFCDQALPSNIKSFNKNGMKSPKFTKDVMGGIESLRSKIVTSSGKRLFYILDIPANKKVITAFQKHRFLLDGQGNPTMEPDDTIGIADIADASRYIGQNIFPVKGPQKPEVSWTDVNLQPTIKQNPTHIEQMRQEVVDRVVEGDEVKISNGKRGGFHFNF